MPLALEDLDSNLVNMDGDEAMVELRLKPQLHGVLMRPQCQRNLVWEQTNAGAGRLGFPFGSPIIVL